VAAALLCATLLFQDAAWAGNDPLAGGTTRLAMDKRFARLLAANGVKLTAKAGARRRGRSLLLPVSGGSLDPTIERGVIENSGTLIFRHGRRRVVVRTVEVKTKREPLVAKVGGSQLKIARAGRVSFERAGFGSAFTARPLRLTAKFATRLGKKLRLRGVFEVGQMLGGLRTEASPATLAVLPVGGATFTPAPDFVSKLDSLFVSLNPIAPMQRGAGPVFSAPMAAEGTIAPDASAGVPRTAGGLEFLQLGSGQVFWRDPWLDLAAHQLLADVDVEPSPTLPGKVGRVAVAALGAGAATSDPGTRAISLSAAPLVLTPDTAAYFNEAFNTDRFQAGEPIGSISLSAQTQ